MKTNYHTHTARCNHAKGKDEDYVLSAIKAGFDELGFSDHTPWNYKSDFIPLTRMTLDEFPDYLQSIRHLKEKYKNQISIKLGLECEYFPEYMDWLKEMIKKEQLDYIILGVHFKDSDETNDYFGYCCTDEKALYDYLDSCLKGMETGLYKYLAHPDLFMRSYPEWDEHCIEVSYAICNKAKELNLPIEYNLNAYVADKKSHNIHFPYPAFWKIASKVGCTTIIGYDAHSNTLLEDTENIKEAKTFLNSLGGLKIIDHLEF